MRLRLYQGVKEIFYFPFYFVSLNAAGFSSFIRFALNNQSPAWRKGDRLHEVVKKLEKVNKKEKPLVVPSSPIFTSAVKTEDYEVEEVKYSKVSLG